MSLFGCNCSCRPSCSGLGVIAAAILGVLVAFLQIAGMVAISAALTGVFFAIAVGYLAVITVAAALARRTAGGCCQSLSTVLAGILGTIALAVVLLVVDIAAGSVLGAILAGALVFFFALTVIATACYARCLCQTES